jgi:nucleotide-binding universal stress UspA family protein
MKILLAIDGSQSSDAAVAEVSRRPWPAQTEVRLITVDAPLDMNWRLSGVPSAFDEIVQQRRVDAQRRLMTAAAVIEENAPALHVVPALLEGSPKDAILDEAEKWGADLIVLGSHGYGAIKRLFLGSVSLAVATNAQCSVELVRTRAESQDTAETSGT